MTIDDDKIHIEFDVADDANQPRPVTINTQQLSNKKHSRISLKFWI